MYKFILPKTTAMSTRIKIVIAEDTDYLRKAYAAIINAIEDFELVAAVTNGTELVQTVNRAEVDIVLTDLKMPGMDGIEACKLLHASHPHVRKIVISMYNDYCLNLQLLKVGVRGFLLKNTPEAEIINCIRQVYNNGMYCHEGATHIIVQQWSDDEEPTEYELEVLRRLFLQQSTVTIADETHKSESVVNHARSELKRKAKAQTDFGIAMWAILKGYIRLGEW